MITVASLWRHPIKSHGREALDRVTLIAGQTMPWDRHWAVTHEKTKFDAANPEWVMCRNFMIGALTPLLAGLWASLDEDAGLMTLDDFARLAAEEAAAGDGFSPTFMSDPDVYICYLPTANPYHELTVHGKFERPGPLMVGIRLP